MSLPPALLQRLAQRGLVNKQKTVNQSSNEINNATSAPIHSAPVENEEVIAEDYDEMEEENDQHQKQHPSTSEEYQYPSQYDLDQETEGGRKRIEDNYWLTQMKVRMAEAGSAMGFKGCPNKYNIWHKCTLYCVNRWGEGITKPNAEYMKRYKRLIRKYPLPNGWTELYDPGCGCYYFACEADNVVSWLPPTHPQSIITKCAATIRRQMDESAIRDENVMADDDDGDNGDNGIGGDGSDVDNDGSGAGNNGEKNESPKARHHREVEEIINASIRKAKSSVITARNKKSADNNNSNISNISNNNNANTTNSINIQEFPSLEEAAYCPTVSLPRKQKSRDLEKTLSKQTKRTERFKDERDQNHERSHHQSRNHETELLDPMDPSAYSHIPSGKWSDGLYNDINNLKKKVDETKQQHQGDKSDNNNSDYQSD